MYESLCDDVIKVIATTDPRVYGCMLMLDRRTRDILLKIDPWRQFTTLHYQRIVANPSPVFGRAIRWLKYNKIKKEYDEATPDHGTLIVVNDPNTEHHRYTETVYERSMYGKPIIATTWRHIYSNKVEKYVYKRIVRRWDQYGNITATLYDQNGRVMEEKCIRQNPATPSLIMIAATIALAAISFFVAKRSA
nr:hypothetical protein K-LCC10_0264 [Kaumoebavirus]